MGNVIDITAELAQAGHRRHVLRIGRMTAGRRAEILANPIQAVAEVEECYGSEIVRLRKAMREACQAMKREPQMYEAGDERTTCAHTAARILTDAIAMPWTHERG